MRRTTYKRRFQTHPELLAQMLALRMSGWSLRALTEIYQVDRTTIRHWVVKYSIRPKVAEIPYRMLPRERVKIEYRFNPQPEVPRPPVHKYQHLFDEEDNVNLGKSYAEYVEDHKRRDPKYVHKVNPYAARPDNLY